MIVDFNSISPSNGYHLLTQTIIPRPIAWILSENEDGSLNLAPFSFFNAVCSDPPLLMVSIGKKPSGEIKDTRRNILSGRDFVIHIASLTQAQVLSRSAATLVYGDSELEIDDLALETFAGCSIPRLADSSVAYHCKFYDSHIIGPSEQAILYAEVIQLYVNDDMVNVSNERTVIDADKMSPLSRLGGANYGALKESFSLKRPK
ncbi:MAG: flavin reductase (DIM6/NTAB) family NADH-FMN oxidoreductase RutF [Cellvibrionaceae bacterium]|jgi:flavin reductase (DIM6/NTAB) family NADH-FMN oxidoreductase RutF